jgi:hypothetical protein
METKQASDGIAVRPNVGGQQNALCRSQGFGNRLLGRIGLLNT